MKKRRKIYLVMVLGMLVILLPGCTKKNSTETVSEHTIVDHDGRTVLIPEKIERIVICSPLPLPSVYCLFAGSAEKLVGIPASSMAAAENSYLAKAFPELLKADTSFNTSGDINIEQLLNLKPDIVFYIAGNEKISAMLENAGLTAVGFSVSNAKGNTIETFANWIGLLEEIFGKSERAEKILSYGRSVEKQVLSRTSALPQEERPKILILYTFENGKMTTYGLNSFVQYWSTSAGGRNVADQAPGVKEINMEQIYSWNPDYIFLTNFNPHLPEDLYDNTVSGNDWSTVNAVVEKHVYKYPLGMYRWVPPNCDTPLSLMWIAKTVHPELFSDIDFDLMVKKYYKDFYSAELTDDELNNIYHPAREAAGK